MPKAVGPAEMEDLGRYVWAAYKHILFQYQIDWIADTSRFKVGCMSRQIGKSFIEALASAIEASFLGINQYHFAASQRQSFEVLRKVKQHLKVIQQLIQMRCLEMDWTPFYLVKPGGRYSQSSVELSNGCIIEALPANPATTRGFTGTLRWDEAAITAKDKAFWAAILPLVTRSRKLKVSVTSTPLGDSGKFYDFMHDDSGLWSKHLVTVDDARSAGLDIDIETLVKGMADPDAIQQEYYCKFLSDATSYFPSDLLRECMYDYPRAMPARGEHFIGVDLGRERDLFALSVIRCYQDIHYHLPVTVLRKATFEEMEMETRRVCTKNKVQRGLIDATWNPQFSERINRYNKGIEGLKFTMQNKHEMVTHMRRRLEGGETLLPSCDPETIRSLNGIRKNITAAGNVTFDGDRDSGIGHCDRAWAAMLAEYTFGRKGPVMWWLD